MDRYALAKCPELPSGDCLPVRDSRHSPQRAGTPEPTLNGRGDAEIRQPNFRVAGEAMPNHILTWFQVHVCLDKENVQRWILTRQKGTLIFPSEAAY